MRTLTLLTMIVALPVSAWAQIGGDTASPPPAVSSQTLRLLNQRVPEVEFVEVPLNTVMDWLQEYTGMNVLVRWQVLEDAGIERDKEITLKLKNIRLSQVLWTIMTEAGGADLKLAYRASGNLLIISTQDNLGQEMVVKVYDVSDLTFRTPNFTNAPDLDLQQVAQQASQGGAGGGGGGTGQSIFEDEDDDDDEDQEAGTEAALQQLINLIIQTIEPDTWVQNGGTGTILAFRRNLVVRNSIIVHQKLGGYVTEE